MNKYKISDYKKYIREHFKDYNIDFKAYYQHILLNNEHAWLFCNPNKAKKSFGTVGNNLQFLVLKQLIKKHNYKLTCYKQYYSLLDRLHKTNKFKKCYCLHKPFHKRGFKFMNNAMCQKNIKMTSKNIKKLEKLKDLTFLNQSQLVNLAVEKLKISTNFLKGV